jgi:hypothetical protein
MEWVSHLAGEPHNDRPACVSPALRSFCVALNDGLGNRERQRMRPYPTRTIGTVEDGLATARGWMALDWSRCSTGLLPTQPWSRIKMHGTPHVGSWLTFLAS